MANENISRVDNNQINQIMQMQILRNLNNGNDDVSKSVAFQSLLNSMAESESSNSAVEGYSTSVNNNSAVVSAYEGQDIEKLPMIVNGRAYYNNSYNPDSVFNTLSENINVTDNSGFVSKELMSRIESSVEKASAKYGVDKDLIMAIINHESAFKPDATSNIGAQGLMQILPSNFASLGITDGYNVEQNIDGGAHLLKKSIDLYNGDEKMGLIAYAGGCGVMEKRGVNSYSDLYKMPDEARKAVPEIIAMYEKRKKGLLQN